MFKNFFKKSDTTDSSGPFDTLYKEMIRSYAICVCTYLAGLSAFPASDPYQNQAFYIPPLTSILYFLLSD